MVDELLPPWLGWDVQWPYIYYTWCHHVGDAVGQRSDGAPRPR